MPGLEKAGHSTDKRIRDGKGFCSRSLFPYLHGVGIGQSLQYDNAKSPDVVGNRFECGRGVTQELVQFVWGGNILESHHAK